MMAALLKPRESSNESAHQGASLSKVGYTTDRGSQEGAAGQRLTPAANDAMRARKRMQAVVGGFARDEGDEGGRVAGAGAGPKVIEALSSRSVPPLALHPDLESRCFIGSKDGQSLAVLDFAWPLSVPALVASQTSWSSEGAALHVQMFRYTRLAGIPSEGTGRMGDHRPAGGVLRGGMASP